MNTVTKILSGLKTTAVHVVTRPMLALPVIFWVLLFVTDWYLGGNYKDYVTKIGNQVIQLAQAVSVYVIFIDVIDITIMPNESFEERWRNGQPVDRLAIAMLHVGGLLFSAEVAARFFAPW